MKKICLILAVISVMLCLGGCGLFEDAEEKEVGKILTTSKAYQCIGISYSENELNGQKYTEASYTYFDSSTNEEIINRCEEKYYVKYSRKDDAIIVSYPHIIDVTKDSDSYYDGEYHNEDLSYEYASGYEVKYITIEIPYVNVTEIQYLK